MKKNDWNFDKNFCQKRPISNSKNPNLCFYSPNLGWYIWVLIFST